MPNDAIAQAANPPNDPLKAKIGEWLEKQGYPLEMYAARCCRDAGLETHQSWYYKDRDSGHQRETDVFAHTRRVPVSKNRLFQLSFTLECKQSRARPWVAFVHPDDHSVMGEKAAMIQRIMPKYTEAWWRNLAHEAGRLRTFPLDSRNPIAHSLARASFDKANDDAAYSALMSATKAAIGIADWLDAFEFDDHSYFTVVIPVLVLDCPLYSCHLDENNEMIISRIERCTLQWGNQVGAMPNTIIEIVTKASLPTLLQEMNAASSAVQSIALASKGIKL